MAEVEAFVQEQSALIDKKHCLSDLQTSHGRQALLLFICKVERERCE